MPFLSSSNPPLIALIATTAPKISGMSTAAVTTSPTIPQPLLAVLTSVLREDGRVEGAGRWRIGAAVALLRRRTARGSAGSCSGATGAAGVSAIGWDTGGEYVFQVSSPPPGASLGGSCSATTRTLGQTDPPGPEIALRRGCPQARHHPYPAPRRLGNVVSSREGPAHETRTPHRHGMALLVLTGCTDDPQPKVEPSESASTRRNRIRTARDAGPEETVRRVGRARN